MIDEGTVNGSFEFKYGDIFIEPKVYLLIYFTDQKKIPEVTGAYYARRRP